MGKRIRFMPTEEEFFGLFDEMADVLVEAAICLKELTLNYDDCEHKTRQLREMEKRSDAAADAICERLNISFVTPIDREDIHSLAKSMDDVLDYIEASADRMKLYGIDKPREEAVELAEVLVEATRLIKQAVAAVQNMRKIEDVLNPCIEINKLENQGDVIQRKALKRLFAEETRPLEVAKWQEIFDRMELATDRCEDVANVLESIVIKNA